jgi:hypothetical protein
MILETLQNIAFIMNTLQIKSGCKSFLSNTLTFKAGGDGGTAFAAMYD